MKNIYIILFFSGICLPACNSGDKPEENPIDTVKSADTLSVPAVAQRKLCFQYNVKYDTVRIQLHIKGTAVTGVLDYDRYEKDDQHGTIKGTLNGDIIKADYTYAAEGTTSVQEVMFRLKGDTLTEGYGDRAERDNKFVFKDSSKVRFDQAFTKTPCP